MSDVRYYICPFCGKESGLYTNINGGIRGCKHGAYFAYGKHPKAEFIKTTIEIKQVDPEVESND